jgi:hypothetical protein
MVSHEVGDPMRIVDLRPLITSYLMAAGTPGKRESEIFHRFKYVPREDVLAELEALWEQEKVQRFTFDKRTVWRATDKINV